MEHGGLTPFSTTLVPDLPGGPDLAQQRVVAVSPEPTWSKTASSRSTPYSALAGQSVAQ